MTLLTSEDLWRAVDNDFLKMHYKVHDLAVARMQLAKVIRGIEALLGVEDMTPFERRVILWLEAAKKEL